MRLLLICTAIAVCFSSCIQEKYILKRNSIDRITRHSRNIYTLESGQPDKGFRSTITEDDGKLVIDAPPTSGIDWDEPDTLQTNDSRIQGNINKVFFKDKSKSGSMKCYRTAVTYFDSQIAVQALTIPLKVRPALTSEALRDSFPSQAISGFNLGFSAGWQFRYNAFRSKKNLFGDHTTKFSITPGGFLGLGAQKLNNANTRGPNRFSIERSAVSISMGFYAMLGFDRFNIGYAIGWDYATGNGRSAWVYQGHHWNGIIVALDIFK